MDAEEEGQPSFTIKKRTKSRPTGSLSRSSSSATLANSPAKLSFGGDYTQGEEQDEEDGGNVPVIRSRGKKTPAGRVREREGGAGTKPKSRLSFGGAAEEEEEVRLNPSITPQAR
jgi:GC-rich sequence DNA-binding factor